MYLFPLSINCFVRRIWAHQFSLFVPRSRDVAYPGSGPAQDLLRICSGLLSLRTISGRLRRSMHNYSILAERAQNWSHI